eukprot:gnl/Chilomastix_caulleri/276.p1 GENE.gnl/Chilomastix_caulleri/276~~gnl/Chilomastix_caulleri/276.p1  ORF type:complete len:160 (+),score=60.49 gnl/Chilomastix_caulleri/276:175-654(+)
MVVDYASFQKFKRYNNYLTEPIAEKDSENCDGVPVGQVCPSIRVKEPSFAILSRYDLRQQGTVHGPSAFGGLDAKTTKYDMVTRMAFNIKPCPHDEGDNVKEGNPAGSPGFLANWNFNNWNNQKVPTQGLAPVNSHGLFQGDYTCQWTEMNGLLHGRTN